MANQADSFPLMSVNDYDKEQSQPPAYNNQSPAPAPQQASTAATAHHPYPPQASASQMSNNTVVVTGQPGPAQLPPVAVTQPAKKPSQGVLILSLILIAICSFNLVSLYCLIPGVILAVLGFNYSHSHDPSKRQTGKGFNGVSLCCSITALITVVVTTICIILYFSIFYGRLNTFYQSYYDSSSYYCRQTCYQQCSSSSYPYASYDQCVSNCQYRC